MKPFLITLLPTLTISFKSFEKSPNERNELLITTEEASDFLNELAKFYQYVHDHLKFPVDANNQKMLGTLYVEFIIGKTGHVDQDAIRVLSPSEVIKITGTIPELKGMPESWNLE